MMKSFKPAMLLVLSIIFISTAEAGNNLIKNGKFSQGLRYWGRQGTKTTIIHIDKGRLFIQRKDKKYSVLFQDVKITTPGVYKISVTVDNQAGVGGQLIVTPFAEGKFHDRQNSYIRFQPQTGVQSLSKLVNLSTDIKKVRIRLVGNKTGIFFTAVSLEKGFSRSLKSIPQVMGKPRMDGRIDDKFWQQAAVLNDFRVLGTPDKLAEVTTTVKLACSDGWLYIAYDVEEPLINKANIVQSNSVSLAAGDDVELFISPDRKNYYQFMVNAAAYKYAMQKLNTKQRLTTSWYDQPDSLNVFNGKWAVAVDKKSGGYSVEMRIKLSDLYKNGATDLSRLYMNFTRHRTVTDGQQYTNWAGLAGNTFHAAKDFPAFKLQNINSKKSSNVTAAIDNSPLKRITRPLSLPKMLIVGKPLKLLINSEQLRLPQKLKFIDDIFKLDDGVKKFIEKGLTSDKNGNSVTVTVTIDKLDEERVKQLIPTDTPRGKSAELFILKVDRSAIKIEARTREGALRALATVALLGSQAKSSSIYGLHGMLMVDAPYFKVRGWDAGGVRRPDKLKELIDLYFLLRLNYLQFEISTYGKYATFPFCSHLNIGKSKFTKQDFRELADYARARGITLVPLFYSWSRAGFIFNKPEYKALAASKTVKNPQKKKWVYNVNGNAFNPATAKLIFDLYDELIDTMDLKYLNSGLDEIHFGTVVDENAPFSKGKSRLDWLKTVITKTSKHLARKGVKMWMFADEVNPYHSGGINGISNPVKDAKKLDSFPRNVTMLPWRYRVPATGRYNSVEFFKQLGFPVVGAACWYRVNNVPTFISDLVAFNGDGIIGTTWGNPLPKYAPVELFSAISLLAYLAWSPENCNLADFPFIPAAIYQHIAFRYGKERAYTSSSQPLRLPSSPYSHSVAQSRQAIGFPAQLKLNFLTKKFATRHGEKIVPFSKNGKPMLIAVNGKSNQRLVIPVNQRVDSISFLHAVNKMYDYNGRKLAAKYAKTTAGVYELIYSDGTSAELSLKLRSEINEWNDALLAKKCYPGIYGSIGGKLQINIPLYTLDNPNPDKVIKSLVIRSGNNKEINLYLFAISLN